MKRLVIAAGLLLQIAGCSQERVPASVPPVGQQQPGQMAGLQPEEDQPVAADARLLPQAATAREVIGILRERVDAGDPKATCQLAREVEFCAGSEEASHRMAMVAARIKADSGAVLNRNDVLQTMAELAKVRSEYCAGMPPATPSDSVNLWRKAALRGHLPSMLQYGAGLAFRQDRLLDTLDELKAYRRDGVEMTKHVARSGNLHANLMLARAYAPRSTGPDLTPLLRQAVSHDAAQALAYYMMAQELQRTVASTRISALQLQTEANGLRLMMTPDEISEGTRRFDELRRTLKPAAGAEFDPIAQRERDMQQPVAGTELCERDEFVSPWTHRRSQL
jgi:TPR repeat protein